VSSTSQLRQSLAAFAGVFHNPNLRRLQLAWAGSMIGGLASAVALAVVAYRAGGATGVGILGVLRMLVPAVISPFAASLADRYRREHVMITADLSRLALFLLLAAADHWSWGVVPIFALATGVSVLGTVFRPAQAALTPSLVVSPEELTAANVVGSTIESSGWFLGPAIGGAVLVASNASTVFIFSALTLLWSAALISRIRYQPAESTESSGDAEPETAAKPESAGMLAGFKAIGGNSDLRLLMSLMVAQTIVAGMLNVLVVVTAEDLVKIGNSGVGYLMSALGVGGLIGSVVAVAMIASGRLAVVFSIGLVLWGVPIALIGVVPTTAVALVMMLLVGLGNTLVDVPAITLLQRSVPDEVLARVFGVFEMLVLASIGLGSLLAPIAVHTLGARAALIVTGAFLPIAVVLTLPRLLKLDAEVPPFETALELLKTVSILRLLPESTLTQLGARLEAVSVPAGEEVFQQGEPGDRFYVIADGSVRVIADGRLIAVLGRGQYFGEIALLRDTARTATVEVEHDFQGYALEREDFITAVTGHRPTAEATESAIGTRLADLRAITSAGGFVPT
jgi:MFS family permease